jgi:hypothetical protein
MIFGSALEAMKKGRKAHRHGWNGQGMFVYYVPPNIYKAQTEAAKNHFGKKVPYRGYLAMKTSQGDVVPWVASQTDLLADDWYAERKPREPKVEFAQ